MGFIPYNPNRYTEGQMRSRIDAMFEKLQNRRSVSEFSQEPVHLEVVQKLIEIANTARSS